MNYFILAKIGNVNMKKTFQKTLVAAAMGVAMLSATGSASANSLLFPYFTTVGTAQSVVSLSLSSTVTERLHYVYNYGPSCIHYDASGSMTPNDILSHSVLAGSFGNAQGKVISTDKSTAVTFPLAGQTGFLVVSTKTSGTTGLRGSMAIIDPVSNLAISYPGVDNALDTSGASEGDFSAIVDSNFGLSFLPSTVVGTSWFGIAVGNMFPAIAAGANWAGSATFTNNGNVYDNDEVAYSGTQTKGFTCQGNVVPTDLMTSAQAAAVGSNGGYIRATASFGGTATGVIMMKTQAISSGIASYGNRSIMHREATAF
jgi:hypothetical protein